MARRWRIRHKLQLGFALVLAIVLLLLGGTLYGLNSYRSTRRIVEVKLRELDAIDQLRIAIKKLSRRNRDARNEAAQFQTHLRECRTILRHYEGMLRGNMRTIRDEDVGREELARVRLVSQRLDQLEKVLNQVITQPMVMEKTVPIVDLPPIESALSDLNDEVDDLRDAVFVTLNRKTEEARDAYYEVLYWVIGISTAGLLLVASLLGRFYTWIVRPIRELQQGVERVAQGDFDHPIVVSSHDEMEELAARFNYMTRELRDLYEDLERQVNERSRQLVRSERLASVGFLAAGVAHEINNPLASIAFCSEALESRLREFLDARSGPQTLRLHQAAVPDDDRETILRYLKMIQEESFRCKKITQRLLEFSRGGEGTRERTDLNEIVQSVIDMVQHLENARGKEIVFQSDEPVIAFVNAEEIKSVVLNLVVNALQNMDEGGRLTIESAVEGANVVIRLTDTGCGMTAEVLENIFEPFYTRSRTGRGTGLGLSISHRIVVQHGGEIEASSPGPDQGSTFVIRLPRQPRASEPGEGGEHKRRAA